jgi:undecaprenyl diphosphate synthase
MELDSYNIPQHIAIIMDGNGRWAEKKGLNRIDGHKKGIESAREIVKECRRIGVKILTLYTFSLENWRRPKNEVDALMELLKEYLMIELNELVENNIRLNAIGSLEFLPSGVVEVLEKVIKETEKNDGMILNLALSYGGRKEIIEAIKKLFNDYERGLINVSDITEKEFSRYLFTKNLPDPDLLIRTSGEYRISNFLLWQMAYSEIYFTETLWPDFAKEELIKAIIEYQARERRFGLTSEQILKKRR